MRHQRRHRYRRRHCHVPLGTPAVRLLRLRRHGSLRIQSSVAHHPETQNVDIHQFIHCHVTRSTPAARLLCLWRRGSLRIRSRVAHRPGAHNVDAHAPKVQSSKFDVHNDSRCEDHGFHHDPSRAAHHRGPEHVDTQQSINQSISRSINHQGQHELYHICGRGLATPNQKSLTHTDHWLDPSIHRSINQSINQPTVHSIIPGTPQFPLAFSKLPATMDQSII